MADASFHTLFVQHWDAGTGMPRDRRRPLGSWTTKDFADALHRLNCPVDTATIERWRNGTNQTNRRATMLAILAVFFPVLADGDAPHPDRQRMLEAWTDAQRRAGRPQPDIAAMQRTAAALLAAPREPDAIGFVVAGTRLAIAPPAESDRAAAALPLVAQLLPLIVEKLRDLGEIVGARLDNQPAWRGLPRAARGLLSALGNATPETLADVVPLLYHRTLTLGTCVDLDDQLGKAPSLQGEPLEPEIRRALADALASLAPWLLQFPSVREADASRAGFLTRPELFAAVRARLGDARQVMASAAATGTLSVQDAEEAAMPAEIAETPGMQGEKAGYRAVATARHLAVTALGWKLSLSAALLTGAVASDYATKSALVGTLGTFLARTEEQAIRLVAGSPYGLVAALRHGLALARDEPREEAPELPDVIVPPGKRRDEDTGPPPDFDLARLLGMIIAGHMPPAEWVPWITTLNAVNTSLVDLGPVAKLTNLRSLEIYNTKVSDLQPIATLTGLQLLDVGQTNATDLTPLAGLTTLRQVHLDRTRVTNLSPLRHLSNLRELRLTSTLVADLRPLAGLSNLQSLDLSFSRVVDLEAIAGLINLRSLTFNYTRVKDLAPLAGLTKLQALSVDNTRVADLTPLSRLAFLRELSLRSTHVATLAPVAALANVERLDLSFTRISDLAAITRLASIQTLVVSNTLVADLAPIAGLANLQSLRLNSTQVASLTPIADLTNLRYLDLDNTKVADLTPIAGLANLEHVGLTDTHVADLAPIAGLANLTVRVGDIDIRPGDLARQGRSLLVADILQHAEAENRAAASRKGHRPG